MVRSRSYIATPPGATIKEQLVDRNMSQKEFAARMDLSEKHISRLINGDVQLTPEVAERLEVVLGVPARFWNNLEVIYREKLIKAQNENDMEADELLVKQLPYTEMEKYGWVPETRNSKERVANLRKYFEVVQLRLLEKQQITKIACERLSVTQKNDLAFLAWVQEARLMARNIPTSAIDIKALIDAAPEIRRMTTLETEEFREKLQLLLAEYGIALVFLPLLKGVLCNSASFVDGNKIVIGLAAIKNDADEFWFRLFHELAHIILGHVGQADGTSVSDELDADMCASDMLISRDDFSTFVVEKDFSSAKVVEYAAGLGIAPGIVVRRLQQEGFIKPQALNDLKKRYEFEVS